MLREVEQLASCRFTFTKASLLWNDLWLQAIAFLTAYMGGTVRRSV